MENGLNDHPEERLAGEVESHFYQCGCSTRFVVVKRSAQYEKSVVVLQLCQL